MKKPFALLFIACLAVRLLAQDGKIIDSLQLRITHERSDSAKALLYSQMAYELFNANLDSAETLVKKEFELARRSRCTTCLIECYRDLGFAQNRRYRLDESILTYDTAQSLAERSGNWCALAGIFSQKGGSFNRKKDWENALRWHRRAADLYYEKGCKGKGFSVNYNLYVTLNNMGRPQESLAPLGRAVEEAERGGGFSQKRLVLSAMANNLIDADRAEESKKFAQKALDLCRSVGDKYGEANALFLLGKAAAHDYDYETARQFGEQAVAAFGDSQDPFLKNTLLSSLALSAAFSGHYDQALEVLKTAMPLAQQQLGQDPTGLSNCLRASARSFQMTGQPEKAEQQWNEAVALTFDKSFPHFMRALALKGLVEFYEQSNQWEKASGAWKRYASERDSSVLDKTKEQLAVVEARLQFEQERAAQDRTLASRELEVANLRSDKLGADFRLAQQSRELLAGRLEAERQAAQVLALETEQREKSLENAALNANLQQKESESRAKSAELQLRDLQASREKWVRLLLFGLAVGGGAAIYFAYRRRQRRQLERLRVDLARDLHDELGSTIGSIALFGKSLQKMLGDVRPDASEGLQKITANAEQSLETVRDIVWTIDSANDLAADLVARAREFALPLAEAAGVDCRIEARLDDPSLRLSPGVKKNVWLIFKEAVSNALRYSGTERLAVEFSFSKTEIGLKVEDFGTGFDPGATALGGGNGLRNMQKRAAELSGTLAVETAPGRGTAVELRCPMQGA